VHVYVDGVLLKALVASANRSDVGSHGFDWAPPPYGPGNHTVDLYAIGVDSSGVPDGNNTLLGGHGTPCTFDEGCGRLTGDPHAWCAVQHYWQRRQNETQLVRNNVVSAGVSASFGGAVMQLYGADWQTQLLDEHGGAACQLSIWGYDATQDAPGAGGWFKRASPSQKRCDPTPYTSEAACQNGTAADCVVRCCPHGSHVLDCKDEQPCDQWSAGAPWNPIQCMGAGCGWETHVPTTNAWVPRANGNGTSSEAALALHTVLPRGYDFTNNKQPLPLQMEQWVSVLPDPSPFVRLQYRMTYAEGTTPDWTPTTQEVPAIFTAKGISSVFYWYDGAAPYTSAPATRVAGGPPPGGFLRLPGRAAYPHPTLAANATEDWWGVCDEGETRCVTVACFSHVCAEAAVANNTQGAGYITPIGLFGVAKAMDLRWELFMFPYRHDEVVGGKAVREWIRLLRAEHERAEGVGALGGNAATSTQRALAAAAALGPPLSSVVTVSPGTQGLRRTT
jgi:hypothetical protein